jgi:hypothetical protein
MYQSPAHITCTHVRVCASKTDRLANAILMRAERFRRMGNVMRTLLGICAVLTGVTLSTCRVLFRGRIAEQSLRRRYERFAGRMDQCAHAGIWNTAGNHAKAGWRALSSVLLRSTVALLKEKHLRNVEFANHYSIVTGSSRKSPMTRTKSQQALKGDG